MRVMNRTLRLALIVVVLTMTMAGTLYAQGDEPIVAGVDRMAVSTDDTVTLTVVVSVNNQNVPPPQLPSLDGFSIMGTSTATQMSVVNGAVSSSVVYTYRLQPYETGILTIDPIQLTLDGQDYFTDPIRISVTQGIGQASPPIQRQQNFEAPSSLGDNDLFVEALVDNPTPYVGEQISYIFRYYEALDALRMPSIFSSQPDYQPPALTGFWAEGDIDVTSYRVSANGRIYTVTELTQVLFPTASGQETIESARIVIPDGGFRDDVVLDTEPVIVDVQPLPVTAPASFAGAVGQFDIQASLDVNQTRVDEPVTLEVTLFGQGNVSTAADPVWPEMDGWRVFESDSSVNTVVENGVVSGSRVYSHLMVPTVAGQFTVPPIEYSYFDPTTGEYRTIATEPIAVAVAPGTGAPSAAMPLAPAVVEAQPALNVAAVDPSALASLKPAPQQLAPAPAPLTAQTWYWALWGIPLAGLVGGYAWERRQRHMQQNAAAVRSARAAKHARSAIAKARKAHGDEADLYAAAGHIMTDYLSAKLDSPVGGMTNEAITASLLAHGLDEEADRALIQRTLACLDSYEYNRYSPVGVSFATPAQLLDEIDAVVGETDARLSLAVQ